MFIKIKRLVRIFIFVMFSHKIESLKIETKIGTPGTYEKLFTGTKKVKSIKLKTLTANRVTAMHRMQHGMFIVKQIEPPKTFLALRASYSNCFKTCNRLCTPTTGLCANSSNHILTTFAEILIIIENSATQHC